MLQLYSWNLSAMKPSHYFIVYFSIVIWIYVLIIFTNISYLHCTKIK